MLTRLIASYQTIDIPPNIDICLIIIENDTCARMQTIVAELSRASERAIHHAWEPRLGIPIARNRSIAEATLLQATHLAFIDDDEWLPQDWLINIWMYYLTQDPGSAIQGPVLSQLPLGYPSYFAHFFQRKIQTTGTRLSMCMTNNVLVPINFFSTYAVRFDETLPFAGGTDSKLFREAHLKGASLVYCAEASVFEEVIQERISYRWLMKRNFRVGLTLGQHDRIESKREHAAHFVLNVAISCKHAFKAAFHALVFNRPLFGKYLLKSCRRLGIALGPLGININAYKTVNGSGP